MWEGHCRRRELYGIHEAQRISSQVVSRYDAQVGPNEAETVATIAEENEIACVNGGDAKMASGLSQSSSGIYQSYHMLYINVDRSYKTIR